MFERFLGYIRGYIRIRLTGKNYEKILNNLMTQNIYIYDIRTYGDYIEGNISINDFCKIKGVVREKKHKFKIVRKRGLPFLMKKYKKRKTFLFGMVVTYLILMVLSTLIWDIKIYGIEKIDRQSISEVLFDSGVRLGAPNFLIKHDMAYEKLYKTFPNIVWLNIYRKGTTMNIEVVESTEKSKEIKDEEPCNIVANKKAIIADIITLKGVPKVRKKDVVNVGEVLVSGEIEVEQGGEIIKKYVSAAANIQGKEYIYIKAEQELEAIIKNYTGKRYKEVAIRIGDFSIKLPRIKPEYKKFDTKESIISILPAKDKSKLAYIVDEHKEYTTSIKKYTSEEVKHRIEEKIYRYLSSKLHEDAKILDVKMDYYINGKIVYVNAVVSVLEKIGEKKPIENY